MQFLERRNKVIKIEVGDVVKKKACRNTGPEAWVTVIKKEGPKPKNWLVKYTVLQPDGSIAVYPEGLLKKQRTVYA